MRGLHSKFMVAHCQRCVVRPRTQTTRTQFNAIMLHASTHNYTIAHTHTNTRTENALILMRPAFSAICQKKRKHVRLIVCSFFCSHYRAHCGRFVFILHDDAAQNRMPAHQRQRQEDDDDDDLCACTACRHAQSASEKVCQTERAIEWDGIASRRACGFVTFAAVPWRGSQLLGPISSWPMTGQHGCALNCPT